jgi:tetratricopeptide (TPR) repeat protein
VLNLRPDADAAREALAFLDYVSGHLAEAKQLVESRLNGAGADYYLYYLHALVLRRLEPSGDPSAALRSLDESLRLSPQFAPAYFQRAKLRNEAGEASRALADLDIATRLDRTYAEPFYLMAQIDYRLGKTEQAEQARHEYTLREKEREEKQQKQLVENRLVQALQ